MSVATVTWTQCVDISTDMSLVHCGPGDIADRQLTYVCTAVNSNILIGGEEAIDIWGRARGKTGRVTLSWHWPLTHIFHFKAQVHVFKTYAKCIKIHVFHVHK